MTPIRPSDGSEPGVVAEGAVGARAAGRFRLFRYEVRRWRDGVITDIDEAVESPHRLSDELVRARRLLELVPQVPTPVWGRDELGAAGSIPARPIELDDLSDLRSVSNRSIWHSGGLIAAQRSVRHA